MICGLKKEECPVSFNNFVQGNDESFMIVNLDTVYDRFKLWMRELPMIEPFYAMKTNSDEAILRVLATLGAGFDCASKEEIDTIIGMGVSAERIIYANPCKSSSFIVHAESRGVNLMTFDSVEELEKIAALHKCPELILRYAVSDPTANNPMSGKFGADPVQEAPVLLQFAADMGLNVVGVSFHVGSGCNDPTAYFVALQHARNLFDIGHQLGHKMEIVDVGGGFPGGKLFASFEKVPTITWVAGETMWDDNEAVNNIVDMLQIAAVVRSAIRELFPAPGVRFIAEPGRFFAARSCALVANVIARKTVLASSGGAPSTRMHYYINDGVYGSFNLVLFHEKYPFGRPLFDKEGEQYNSTIWGGTCDSRDKLETNQMMRKLDVGEWLIYEEMGAYTTVASTTFNGFPRPVKVHVISERVW
ncbi:hypothetical protein PRIPAC_80552 [Pristionchus pacificus]|uniref:Orn/DAP/Arg decarboxylase 2 N-terminal domain-containing protein n=1 Tax=Pristionchus pacificus TaxID=54126 RepID=A0A2A6CP35_PRIPA|nr:hypothetical protein PRIPAC_80552 [Pristionchus pacificus]|eukprot:PDM79880.1 hypothetical protein PRIPAC_32459 [Pristionchus pacificus]